MIDKGVIVDGVVYDRVSSTKIPDDYFRVKFVEFLDANGWMFMGVTVDAERKSTDDLLTENYTQIWHEDERDMKFGAPHHFQITETMEETDEKYGLKLVCLIHMQEGPIKENGVNGCANEDLLNIVLCRLNCFERGEYACRENALAITKIEEALMWLRKRTNARIVRNVEGTSKV